MRVVRPILALVLLVSAGCSESPRHSEAASEGAAAPKKVERLTVYSGRTEQLVGPIIAAFEKDSGIEVVVKYGDTAELAGALLEEGNRTPADVFLAQDASTLAFLETKQRFARLPDPVLARVAPGFRSKDGRWIGVTGRARVLAYSTERVRPEDLPKTAAELADPRWKGRIGWAPANASFQSAIAAMIQQGGADAARTWLQQLRANHPKDYPKNTPAVLAISRGEIDVALVNHYYLYRLRDEHGDGFPVANHYFRDGSAHSMLNLSGAAVLAGSKKHEAAAALIGFMLSEAGQRMFVEQNTEFPLAVGVASPHGLPDADSLAAPELELAGLDNLEATVRMLRDVGALP